MTEFAKAKIRFSSPPPSPQSWWIEPYGMDHEVAVLSCPKCGKAVTLGHHKIADDGAVSTSIVCPFAPCDFHEFGKLLGWEPGKVRRA